MIVAHLPLARRMAIRYGHAAQPLDDLVQVASLGLVKAVDRWNPERGVPFAAFAVPTILGELRRYFRDLTWDVRPPRDTQELWLAIAEVRDELQGATGREPGVAELAARLRRPAGEIAEALTAGRSRFSDSLDAPGDGEDADSLGDRIGREDVEYERAEARATIERLTAILDERAREIIRLRYKDDLFQSEIAARLGTSQVQVSRVLRASLERLSAYCDARTTVPVMPPAAA